MLQSGPTQSAPDWCVRLTGSKKTISPAVDERPPFSERDGGEDAPLWKTTEGSACWLAVRGRCRTEVFRPTAEASATDAASRYAKQHVATAARHKPRPEKKRVAPSDPATHLRDDRPAGDGDNGRSRWVATTTLDDHRGIHAWRYYRRKARRHGADSAGHIAARHNSSRPTNCFALLKLTS